MKNKSMLWSLLAIVMAVSLSFGFTSCGGDDDDDKKDDLPEPKEEVVLTLSGLDAEFPAEAGSLQTAQVLTIKCTSDWVMTVSADWLAVSNRDGSGNLEVKVYPKTENDSDQPRTATITVTAGDKEKTKTVTQVAGINGKLYVKPNEVVILAEGFACDWTYGEDVMYYYTKRYLATELDRKTDKEIIAALSSDDDNRDTPSDGYVTSWSNQTPLTNYVICTVGYDKNGKSGGLMKYPVTTKKGTNQALAYISEVGYDDTYWYWKTSPNGFVTKYYQWFVTSSSLHTTSDAAIAWFFKRNLKQSPDNFPPIVKEDSWQRQRSGGTIFDLVTWALDVDGNYSGMIDRFAGQISNSSRKLAPSIIQYDSSKSYKTLKPEGF